MTTVSKVVSILFCMAILWTADAAAEDAMAYSGTWKWINGPYAKNDPGGVTGTVTKTADGYTGVFTWTKQPDKSYEIDMKAEANANGEALTGSTKIKRKTFSMTGTRAEDGSINIDYSNGRDDGWMKIKPAEK